MLSDKVKFVGELYAIEAWRNGATWVNNRETHIDTFEDMRERELSPRVLLPMLRKKGYLTEKSRGKVCVDYYGTEPEIHAVVDKATGEPLFELRVQEAEPHQQDAFYVVSNKSGRHVVRGPEDHQCRGFHSYAQAREAARLFNNLWVEYDDATAWHLIEGELKQMRGILN